MPVPKLRQAASRMIEGIDQFSLPSQFGPSTPNQPRKVLSSPPSVCRMNFQTTATATTEVIVGRKKPSRKNARNLRIPLSRATAAASASPRVSGTPMTTK